VISLKSGALVWAAFCLARERCGCARFRAAFGSCFCCAGRQSEPGIIPVPAKLGNGEDPEHNLYWGSAYGVKTFFARSADWEWIACGEKPKAEVLERCVFKHRATKVYLVADAYRGREIRQAILDFLSSAAGDDPETVTAPRAPKIPTRGGAKLVVYIGHDGLMDFQLQQFPRKNEVHRDAIVLACGSKQVFAEPVRASGAYPLLGRRG
jgi:hypothetical protein